MNAYDPGDQPSDASEPEPGDEQDDDDEDEENSDDANITAGGNDN